MSHDFGTLRGQRSSMMAAFDFIHAIKPSLYMQLIFSFAPILYDLFNVILTSDREQRLAQSVAHLNVLTTDLLSKARKEPEDSEVHRSILGILSMLPMLWGKVFFRAYAFLIVKSQNANSNSRLSLPEITTQVRGSSPHRRRCLTNILCRPYVVLSLFLYLNWQSGRISCSWLRMKLQQVSSKSVCSKFVLFI